ncbi:YicC/YloC family endoribonuclease [Yunchengibacter salinarum]|uniref:YicC/YloC family endoribonuclease n=1 Tax=Yunchengibacter salinarum TaxID=3133399 RepID=UPI0035B5ACD8
MTVTSMTGYFETSGTVGDRGWTLAVKSVNGRGLDVRVRVPAALDGLDLAIKRRVAEKLARGSVSVTLGLESGATGTLRINDAMLEAVRAAADTMVRKGQAAPARADGLLALPGVMTDCDPGLDGDARAVLEAAVLDGLDDVLQGLVQARRDEGARLTPVLTGLVDELAATVDAAAQRAGDREAAARSRMEQALTRLTGLDSAVPEDRLAQELALIAVKADVFEEIDRLRAHLDEARSLLNQAAPKGRRLDFLSQELNREANTLCAKSGDVALTRLGMTLKSLIDRLREQALNVE